ncbi:MAG TPA: hypothetical protein VM238_11640 [Phycisphaerae bacterium]|nr:hypothetical protein [Phycisphaerae bacterium]
MVCRAWTAWVLVSVLAAAAALGQEAQRLAYRSPTERGFNVMGARSAHLSVQEDPPPGVALPAPTGRQPRFARWSTPMVPAGHLWLMLCRSGKDNVYDRLYVDTDADGSLADETVVQAQETDPGLLRAGFPLVEVRFPGEGGPTRYQLRLYSHNWTDHLDAYVYAAAWYEGPVAIGGETLWCALVDNNSNGRFNDAAMGPGLADVIFLAPKAEDIQLGQDIQPDKRYLGRHIEAGGKVYAMEVPPGGGWVRFTPAPAIPMGRIRVPDGVTRFSVWGNEGFFFCRPVGGVAAVPAGAYQVHEWEVVRRDPSGVAWQLRTDSCVPAYATSPENRFAVEAGKETALGIGEPAVSRFTVRRGRRDYYITHTFRSERGDRLLLLKRDERPPPTQLTICSADGSYSDTLRVPYG